LDISARNTRISETYGHGLSAFLVQSIHGFTLKWVDNQGRPSISADSLVVTDGTFSWLPDIPPILKDIDMRIPTGSLTAIVGPVGCGKSSLLAACVGDLFKVKGDVMSKVRSNVAAWAHK